MHHYETSSLKKVIDLHMNVLTKSTYIGYVMVESIPNLYEDIYLNPKKFRFLESIVICLCSCFLSRLKKVFCSCFQPVQQTSNFTFGSAPGMGGFGGGNPFGGVLQQSGAASFGAAFGGSQFQSGFGFCQAMPMPPSRAAFGSSSQGFGSNAGMGRGSQQQQQSTGSSSSFGGFPQQQSLGSSSLFGGFPQQQSTGSSSLFGFGQQQNETSFGGQQQIGEGFGGQQHVGAGFGGQQRGGASFGGQQQIGASFGGQQHVGAGFGDQQRGGASFGGQQHVGAGFGGQQPGWAGFGGQQSNLMFGSVSNFHNKLGGRHCRECDSWIYNYLCNQCLSPLKLRVHGEMHSIQHYVINFVSGL